MFSDREKLLCDGITCYANLHEGKGRKCRLLQEGRDLSQILSHVLYIAHAARILSQFLYDDTLKDVKYIEKRFSF